MPMRSDTISSKGVSVRAVSGTHVVFLAFNLSAAARTGCLGFAIKRRDNTEDDEYWLEGLKTFQSVDPAPGPGVPVSTRLHPLQGFQWADYTAKPDHTYTYEVSAMRGTPAALEPRATVSVKIRTEPLEAHSVHRVHFNRGAVASQEYARRFQNRRPDDVADGSAYRWLSRGLEEAMLAFIGRANSKDYELRAAIYEFQWPAVLDAFKQAANKKANVKIIYDAVAGATGPKKKNDAAIKEAGIKGRCIPRTKGKLMHNKFIVLLKKGKPVSVWTGSTNATLNGIFGHLNVGHEIADPDVAARYFECWNVLAQDPTPAELKDWGETHDPLPPEDSAAAKGTRIIFSPHRGLQALRWYAQMAKRDSLPIFITLAFGMNKLVQAVYKQTDGVLRVALLEKPGNGAGLKQGRIDVQNIRNLPNVLVAMGNYVTANSFDRWLKEIDRVTAEVNVRWVHTKFMMIDPLGAKPIVITGSANFSDASTDTNDENMLVISGDKRVADIYFTEFLRIYTHHAFRESLTFKRKPGTEWKPNYLDESPKWQTPYFAKGNERYLRRLYYMGV
jgi:phosphatidylserine/phosphatidylglycerophosphate/cardiolipin synthase-like enzyme